MAELHSFSDGFFDWRWWWRADKKSYQMLLAELPVPTCEPVAPGEWLLLLCAVVAANVALLGGHLRPKCSTKRCGWVRSDGRKQIAAFLSMPCVSRAEGIEGREQQSAEDSPQRLSPECAAEATVMGQLLARRLAGKIEIKVKLRSISPHSRARRWMTMGGGETDHDREGEEETKPGMPVLRGPGD